MLVGRHNHFIRNAMARHNTNRLNPVPVYSPDLKKLQQMLQAAEPKRDDTFWKDDFVEQIGQGLREWFDEQPFIASTFDVERGAFTHKHYTLKVKRERMPTCSRVREARVVVELKNEHIHLYFRVDFGDSDPDAVLPYEDPSMFDLLRTAITRFYNHLP